MLKLGIFTMMMLTIAPYAMDPAFTTNDTEFTKELKSRVVWVPFHDESLTSFLKHIETSINADNTNTISFRLFDESGNEEILVYSPATNAIPSLGGFRASLYDFAKYISETGQLDWRFDDKNREIVFRRKAEDTQPAPPAGRGEAPRP